MLRGACPERHEILRYAQNDTKRRARNDKENFIGSNLMCQCQVRRLCIYWAVYAISKEMFIMDRGK